MFNLNNRAANDRLDHVGRELVRAVSQTNDEATEAANAAPFLYARLRSSIEAERQRRAYAAERWLAALTVVRRATAAMALTTAVVVGTVSFVGEGMLQGATSNDLTMDENILDARDAAMERAVFTDVETLSNDEVLATIIVDADEQGTRP